MARGLHRRSPVSTAGRTWVGSGSSRPRRGRRRTPRIRATVGGAASVIAPGWREEASLERLDGRAVAWRLVARCRRARTLHFPGPVVDATPRSPGCGRGRPRIPTATGCWCALLDPDGRPRGRHAPVGFRSVEVRDRQLLVNGAPVASAGSTATTTIPSGQDGHGRRHAPGPGHDGRSTSTPCAARTTRTTPRFYDLCDELGLYVVDEADIESHAHSDAAPRPPLPRAFSSGAPAWSSGTRTTPASSLVARQRERLRRAPRRDGRVDPRLRPDPAAALRGRGHGRLRRGRAVTDLMCPMYPPIDSDRGVGGRAGEGDRPLIMCEYSHAMGNSNGSLADYWEAIEATRAAGRVHLGVEGPRPGRARGGRSTPTAASSATSRTTPTSWPTASSARRATPSRRCGSVARSPARSRRAGQPAPPARAGAQRPVVHRLAGLQAQWELLVDGEVRQQGVLRRAVVPAEGLVELEVPFDLGAGRRRKQRTPRPFAGGPVTMPGSRRPATRWRGTSWPSRGRARRPAGRPTGAAMWEPDGD